MRNVYKSLLVIFGFCILTAAKTITAPKDNQELLEAAKNGQEEKVKELLKKGADPHCKDENGTSALMEGSRGGHLEVVKQLIKAKSEPNASDTNGQVALMLAAFKGHLDIVKELIKAKAKVNASDNIKNTALMNASRQGHLDIVKELIKAKAKVNAKSSLGGTAFMHAAKGGHLDVVKELLRAGANVNVKTNEGKTALMYAARGGYLEIVEQLLKVKAKTNVKDTYGRTALFYAAMDKDIYNPWTLIDSNQHVHGSSSALHEAKKNIVQLLLDQRMNPNARDKDGRTPLMYAAREGYKEIVRLLIKKGGKTGFIDQTGQTARTLAFKLKNEKAKKEVLGLLQRSPLKAAASLKSGSTKQMERALMTAIIEEDTKSVKDIFLHLRYKPNIREKFRRYVEEALFRIFGKKHKSGSSEKALWTAVCGNHKEIVRFILGYNINVDSVDKYGKTALMKAAENGSQEIVQLLLRRGANKSIRDKRGNTALSTAIAAGHKEVVKLFFEQNIAEALALSVLHQQKEIAELLIKYAREDYLSIIDQEAIIEAASNGHKEAANNNVVINALKRLDKMSDQFAIKLREMGVME